MGLNINWEKMFGSFGDGANRMAQTYGNLANITLENQRQQANQMLQKTLQKRSQDFQREMEGKRADTAATAFKAEEDHRAFLRRESEARTAESATRTGIAKDDEKRRQEAHELRMLEGQMKGVDANYARATAEGEAIYARLEEAYGRPELEKKYTADLEKKRLELDDLKISKKVVGMQVNFGFERGTAAENAAAKHATEKSGRTNQGAWLQDFNEFYLKENEVEWSSREAPEELVEDKLFAGQGADSFLGGQAPSGRSYDMQGKQIIAQEQLASQAQPTPQPTPQPTQAAATPPSHQMTSAPGVAAPPGNTGVGAQRREAISNFLSQKGPQAGLGGPPGADQQIDQSSLLEAARMAVQSNQMDPSLAQQLLALARQNPDIFSDPVLQRALEVAQAVVG